jgi:uncharacterized protein (TIGR00255 family)
MTGYGRASRRATAGSITVELRSTNHRYLEVDQRLPNGLTAIQGRLTELMQQRLRRGRIEVLVFVQARYGDRRRITFDEPLLQHYYEALVSLKGRFGLKGHVSLDQLLALPQAVTVAEERLPTEQLWDPIRQTAEAALAALVRTRQREGTRLVADLRRQIQLVETHARQIKTRLPRALEQQRQHLRERLRELLAASASRSVSQLEEAVALVRDADIHEELVRLDSHLAHMRQTLSSSQVVGKQLDFIAQELMRETNTIGAKVNDPQAARHVVEIKGCIEKIREQVQNLE